MYYVYIHKEQYHEAAFGKYKSSTDRLYFPNLSNIFQTLLLSITLHKYLFRSVLYSNFSKSPGYQQGMPDSP
jgi:hypothetical protein